MKDVDTKELIRELRSQGWEVEKGNSGHYKCTPPNPKMDIVYMSTTSSDFRAMRNNISQLKKSGFVSPWEPDSRRGEEPMDNGEGTTIDYLEHVLDAFQEVHGTPVDQVVFERNGKAWTAYIPVHEPVRVAGTSSEGTGETPSDALKEVMSTMRATIKERIRKLQELEARIG